MCPFQKLNKITPPIARDAEKNNEVVIGPVGESKADSGPLTEVVSEKPETANQLLPPKSELPKDYMWGNKEEEDSKQDKSDMIDHITDIMEDENYVDEIVKILYPLLPTESLNNETDLNYTDTGELVLGDAGHELKAGEDDPKAAGQLLNEVHNGLFPAHSNSADVGSSNDNEKDSIDSKSNPNIRNEVNDKAIDNHQDNQNPQKGKVGHKTFLKKRIDLKDSDIIAKGKQQNKEQGEAVPNKRDTADPTSAADHPTVGNNTQEINDQLSYSMIEDGSIVQIQGPDKILNDDQAIQSSEDNQKGVIQDPATDNLMNPADDNVQDPAYDKVQDQQADNVDEEFDDYGLEQDIGKVHSVKVLPN